MKLPFDPEAPLPDSSTIVEGSKEAKVAALQTVFKVTRKCVELEDLVCYAAEMAGCDAGSIYDAWAEAQPDDDEPDESG